MCKHTQYIPIFRSHPPPPMCGGRGTPGKGGLWRPSGPGTTPKGGRKLGPRKGTSPPTGPSGGRIPTHTHGQTRCRRDSCYGIHRTEVMMSLHVATIFSVSETLQNTHIYICSQQRKKQYNSPIHESSVLHKHLESVQECTTELCTL